MKIFILHAVLAIVVLTGCHGTIDRENKTRREAENKAIINSLRTVEYNGHTYIVYREVYGTKNFGGIAHDPECGCEEIEYYGCEVINVDGNEGAQIIQ